MLYIVKVAKPTAKVCPKLSIDSTLKAEIMEFIKDIPGRINPVIFFFPFAKYACKKRAPIMAAATTNGFSNIDFPLILS